ncbi:MAG: hypothetical protein AAFU79_23650, partial [Myxococcota bacterium]
MTAVNAEAPNSSAAPHGEPRTGPELIRATKPFSEEDEGTTWRLFITTCAVAGACMWATAWESVDLPFRLLFAVILGLTYIRLFIFFHDAMHGAVFKKSKLGKRIMKIYGHMILVPDRVWKDSHN